MRRLGRGVRPPFVIRLEAFLPSSEEDAAYFHGACLQARDSRACPKDVVCAPPRAAARGAGTPFEAPERTNRFSRVFAVVALALQFLWLVRMNEFVF